MQKRFFIPALVLLAPALAWGENGPFGNLNTVASSGALGNFSQYTFGDGNPLVTFNTDTGQIRNNSSGGFLIATLAHTTVQEYAGGPTINVYNFANFDSPVGDNYSIVGSEPAVITATGSITIGGNIQIDSGGGAGGPGGYSSSPYNLAPGYSGGNAGGGGGGAGPGVVFSPSIYGGYSGGPGGGGGSVSPGGGGSAGTMQDGQGGPSVGYSEAGGVGGFAQNTAVLQGGGGGGGGAGANIPGETAIGAVGGAGGGALFFITPGNITVDLNASLSVDGHVGNGGNNGAGSSGGGAAGELWIDAGGTFLNNGGVDAVGGAGGNIFATGDQTGRNIGGAGAGGDIIIDPTQIINDGTINVSDGSGDNTYGGNVELLADGITGSGQVIGQVPEPSSLLVLIPSLTGLFAMRRRKV